MISHGGSADDDTHAGIAAALLHDVFADPDRSLASARELLTRTQDPAVLSIARQVIGIVLRDRGEMAPALAELRHALRLARTAGDVERVADVNATLGATLVMDGRTAQGLAHLDLARRALAVTRSPRS